MLPTRSRLARSIGSTAEPLPLDGTHAGSPAATIFDVASAIEEVSDGSGVIILTDLFGGTPSNLAISLLRTGEVEVIAGINLPMLIRLAGARVDMPVTQAVVAARDAGRNYITVASEFLGQDA